MTTLDRQLARVMEPRAARRSAGSPRSAAAGGRHPDLGDGGAGDPGAQRPRDRAHPGRRAAAGVKSRLRAAAAAAEGRDLFREWLRKNYPDRRSTSFRLVCDMRGGGLRFQMVRAPARPRGLRLDDRSAIRTGLRETRDERVAHAAHHRAFPRATTQSIFLARAALTSRRRRVLGCPGPSCACRSTGRGLGLMGFKAGRVTRASWVLVEDVLTE